MYHLATTCEYLGASVNAKFTLGYVKMHFLIPDTKDKRDLCIHRTSRGCYIWMSTKNAQAANNNTRTQAGPGRAGGLDQCPPPPPLSA